MMHRQTERDILEQRRIALEVMLKVGWDQVIHDVRRPCDCLAVVAGKPVCAFEVKRRYNPMLAYPTVYIAEHKRVAVRSRANVQAAIHGVELAAWFVVGWDDQIGILDLDRMICGPLVIAGRIDRIIKNGGERTDMEPMNLVPLSQFRLLSEVGHEYGKERHGGGHAVEAAGAVGEPSASDLAGDERTVSGDGAGGDGSSRAAQVGADDSANGDSADERCR